MYQTKKLVSMQRFSMYHVAAIQIQWFWRKYKQQFQKVSIVDQAAHKIQRRWRSHTNTKIFQFFKQLIEFKERGDPRELLRSINPRETQLLDVASNVHVRFRLGGEKFPPTVYYKIFTHGGLCDVNSYAPRDYNHERRTLKDAKKHLHPKLAE